MKDYPFRERLKRGLQYTVVELAIEGGVPNVVKYATRVETMVSDGNRVTTVGVLYAR
jgi:hypothetical protein